MQSLSREATKQGENMQSCNREATATSRRRGEAATLTDLEASVGTLHLHSYCYEQ